MAVVICAAVDGITLIVSWQAGPGPIIEVLLEGTATVVILGVDDVGNGAALEVDVGVRVWGIADGP